MRAAWVEHRLFSFISSNWRGEPLRDYETVMRLIAGTTTAKGLKVTCRLDHRKYPVGRKITDEEFANVNRMRQRNYRVDRGGSLDYRRAAAQAVGVSSASR